MATNLCFENTDLIKDPESSLIYAIIKNNIDKFNSLIEQDKSIVNNEIDRNGNTPLIIAVHLDRLEMVVSLVNNGAHVDHLNKHGKNALMVACEYKKHNCTELDSVGRNHNQRNMIEILHLVSDLNSGIEKAINHADENGVTLLMKLCERRDYDIGALVSASTKLDANYMTNRGWTALDYLDENDLSLGIEHKDDFPPPSVYIIYRNLRDLGGKRGFRKEEELGWVPDYDAFVFDKIR